jgi:flavorubredoxin
MPTLLILYNTKTGNTEQMAHAVEQGAHTIPGVQVTLTYHATPDDLANADALAIGAPTYNHQMTLDIQRLFEKTAQTPSTLANKPAAAFGSYGWSGEAPHHVLEILQNKFQAQVIKPPILAKYTPNAATLQKCRELGTSLAQTLSEDQPRRRE